MAVLKLVYKISMNIYTKCLVELFIKVIYLVGIWIYNVDSGNIYLTKNERVRRKTVSLKEFLI